MKAQCLLLAILIGFVVLCWGNRADAETHPIVNKPLRTWQVGYDAAHPNKGNSHHAVRLVFKDADNEEDINTKIPIEATLYLFAAHPPGNPAIYKLTRKIEMKGSVSGAPGRRPIGNPGPVQTHWKRARVPFELHALDYDNKNNTHLLSVRGDFHPGKNNKKTEVEAAARTDDRLEFSIVRRRLTSPNTVLATLARMEQLEQQLPLGGTKEQQLAFFRLIFDTMFSGTVPCDDAPPMDAADEVTVAEPTIGIDPYADYDYEPAYMP